MSTLDDKLVKKAYTKVRYTPEMIEEFSKCEDPVDGPMYFMENFMYIQHPVKGKLKFKPFQYQRELCDVYHNYRYSIAMIGRQLGKTTLAAGYLLWYAMFKPDSLILIAAHKREGATEIMEKIRYAYEDLPDHIRAGVTEYNKQSMKFDNGSRIISQATTPNTGRGLAISLVYLDEFAFVQPRIAKEFWTALSPTLSTGGKCIITSTPNVDDDQFATIWHDSQQTIDEFGNDQDMGKNGFKGYYATWRAHPDRDEEWARQERSKTTDDRFEREHECKFISFQETLIKSSTLAKLNGIVTNPIRKSGQVRWYEPIKDGKTYCVALDPSMGTGGDFAAIEVLELPSMKQVAEWQHNRSIIEEQLRVLRQILTEIRNDAPNSDIYWTLENNSLGEAALVVIRDTGEERFPGTMMHDPNRHLRGRQNRKGYSTTNKTKMEACSKLKTLLENESLQIKSKNFAHELKYYIAQGNGYEAASGEHDDLISAMLVVLRMAQHVSTWDDKLHDAINSNIGGAFEEDEEFPMPLII